VAARAQRSALQRYVLFQLPGLVLAAVLAAGLYRWAGAPAWAAVAFWATWLLKDVVLYPKLRAAYEDRDPRPAVRLIGRRGVVTQMVAPTGYIRIGGELWSAEASEKTPSLDVGAAVEVIEARGLTLIVQALPKP
jgi:membrane protein implicated in regulation of membrane protease activity